jgi:hypothetical protein
MRHLLDLDAEADDLRLFSLEEDRLYILFRHHALCDQGVVSVRTLSRTAGHCPYQSPKIWPRLTRTMHASSPGSCEHQTFLHFLRSERDDEEGMASSPESLAPTEAFSCERPGVIGAHFAACLQNFSL